MTPLQHLIDTLERSDALHDLHHLRERLDALDRIELLQLTASAPESTALRQRTLAVQERFDTLNTQLYARMRDDVRGGLVPPLLKQCLDQAQRDDHDGAAFDWRDELIGGVLQLTPPVTPDAPMPADMVAYQPTQASQIFSLLAQTRMTADDVLMDLGSGLGHVPLLTAICTDARAIGIEREPAYVACARAAAKGLQLSRVHFDAADARAADFSRATVFYLYTPFAGTVLQSVLQSLQREAEKRVIRIATHGPCVAAVSAQSWLETDTSAQADCITVFRPRR